MKLDEFVRRGGLRRLGLALLLCVAPVLASGPGPNGVNIGFDFNWNRNIGPMGYTASFIASTSNSGGTLQNCATSALTTSTSACDFVFAYSIGGVPRQGVVPGGAYITWPSPANCQLQSETAPLTLFNCFNANSFGQIFLASSSGQLTGFSMNMTCLNPSGTPPTGLVAALYQVNPGGGSIPATPIATTPVNLSTCPTLTNWTGHTFSGSDFAAIPMNFSGASLTSGSFYAVYFGGLVPGAPLPGSPTITSVAPSSGSLSGGNTVTITGTNLTGATSVTFGGTASASFTVVNSTTITAVVPGGAAIGSVSVMVVTPNGSNTVNTLYSYSIAVPTVTSVSPSSGPPTGGNTVTITGTGFTGATSVTFGGTASPNFTVVNDTTIVATVPSGTSGPASVIVTTPGGSNTPNTVYTYVIPTPTLGEWGMIGLAALLVLYACFKLRRDQRFEPS